MIFRRSMAVLPRFSPFQNSRQCEGERNHARIHQAVRASSAELFGDNPLNLVNEAANIVVNESNLEAPLSLSRDFQIPEPKQKVVSPTACESEGKLLFEQNLAKIKSHSDKES
jgi:hypothetical protein